MSKASSTAFRVHGECRCLRATASGSVCSAGAGVSATRQDYKMFALEPNTTNGGEWNATRRISLDELNNWAVHFHLLTDLLYTLLTLPYLPVGCWHVSRSYIT